MIAVEVTFLTEKRCVCMCASVYIHFLRFSKVKELRKNIDTDKSMLMARGKGGGEK